MNAINTIICNHLSAIANRAIADRNLTYFPGTYTAKHLDALTDIRPQWNEQLRDKTVSVIIDNRKLLECVHRDIFNELCDHGGGELTFEFVEVKADEPTPEPAAPSPAPVVAMPTPEKPKDEHPKKKMTLKRKKKTEEPAAPAVDGDTRPAAPAKPMPYDVNLDGQKVIEKNKSGKAVEVERTLLPLNERFCIFVNAEKTMTRLYLHLTPTVKMFVGATKGVPTEETLPTKYTTIAYDGIRTAIDKGAIKCEPYMVEAYELAGDSNFAAEIKSLIK